MSDIIPCDTMGCVADAEWKDERGNRWCDVCKRSIVAHEKATGVHRSQRTQFRHEKRVLPEALDAWPCEELGTVNTFATGIESGSFELKPDIGDRGPLFEQCAVFADRLTRMEALLRAVMPETMGGTPDLFSPAQGWDEWEDEANAILTEKYTGLADAVERIVASSPLTQTRDYHMSAEIYEGRITSLLQKIETMGNELDARHCKIRDLEYPLESRTADRDCLLRAINSVDR